MIFHKSSCNHINKLVKKLNKLDCFNTDEGVVMSTEYFKVLIKWIDDTDFEKRKMTRLIDDVVFYVSYEELLPEPKDADDFYENCVRFNKQAALNIKEEKLKNKIDKIKEDF